MHSRFQVASIATVALAVLVFVAGRRPEGMSSSAGASPTAAPAPVALKTATIASRALPTTAGANVSTPEWTERRTDPAEPAIVSEWVRPGEATLVARLRAEIEASARGTLALSLGPNRDFAVRVLRVRDLGGDEGVVVGRIDNHPNSTVVLSYVRDAAAGTVHLPNSSRALNLYRTEDGVLRVIEIDLLRAPECGEAVVAQNDAPMASN